MRYIDRFLNSITMYRLVLIGLEILAAISLVATFFGKLSFNWIGLIVSFLVLMIVCYVVNFGLAKVLKAPMNIESAGITALILFFIIAPPESGTEVLTIVALAALAMISKFAFTINHKHLFNPAAIAAVIIGLGGSGMAIWWVGSVVLLPFTLILGLLIVRKIRRFEMFATFLLVSLLALIISGISVSQTWTEVLAVSVTSWPLIFFGTIMLTEPATTPPGRKWQIMYAAVVGVLFSIQFKIGSLYSTPELALVTGNIFSYIVSPKQKLRLILESSRRLSGDIYEFIFLTKSKLIFKAGQYLEWTLPPLHLDNRGNRRYFTIASSPTEETIRLGVRVFEKSSSFKKQLMALKSGEEIFTAQLSGDFVLPTDKTKKLVFIAGGIGITPFRSMIKYLIDQKEKRDIVLLYAVLTPENLVYRDIFEEAKSIGLRTEYVITDSTKVPNNWSGRVGYINEKMLSTVMTDYKERMYYLSGPEAMVATYTTLLCGVGIPRKQVRKDYFPGF
jgi:ferredoxin-NADP reductase